MIKRILGVIVLLVLLATGAMFYAGWQSQQMHTPPLVKGQLPPCPPTPNCVSSLADTPDAQRVPAIALSLEALPTIMTTAQKLVKRMGGTVVTQTPTYLAAEFRSGVFGFIDDFQLHLDTTGHELDIRSSSRVGHSDLGVNRARVEQFRHSLIQTVHPVSD